MLHAQTKLNEIVTGIMQTLGLLYLTTYTANGGEARYIKSCLINLQPS